MGSLIERLGRCGVIPVLAIERPEVVLGLADALAAGGLPIAEITFRTTVAADAMRRIWAERPGVLIGAGTVLTPENAVRARDAGAQFLVTPGLNPAVVRKAHDLRLPIIPGIQTPSEIEEALDLGCKVVKLFPAEAAGGVKLIRALAGPYQHTGVRFLPTGGVTALNLQDYLAEETVLAVGGTWIARKDEVSAERWDTIGERCREAAAIVARVRGGAGRDVKEGS